MWNRSVGVDDAVRRLTEGGIDLVLLDLNLPDSRGLSTVTRVVEANPRVSVVVLTGVDDEETELQAIAASADDYLVKMVLDKRQLQRALQASAAVPDERSAECDGRAGFARHRVDPFGLFAGVVTSRRCGP